MTMLFFRHQSLWNRAARFDNAAINQIASTCLLGRIGSIVAQIIRPTLNRTLSLATIIILLSGCGGTDRAIEGTANTGNSTDRKNTETKIEQAPLIIAVSYPLEYLTQRIAGSDLRVICPVPNGHSASLWKPERGDILLMQKADMVIANGIGARYAKWLEMASIPRSKVCNSATKGLSLDDFIEVEDVVYTHSHGDLGEHSHPTNVAYTWLNPELAAKQARFICKELQRKFPQRADGFAARLAVLEQDLAKLMQRFESVLQTADKELMITVTTANPDLKFFSRGAQWDDRHLKWFEPPAEEVAADELQAKLDLQEGLPFVRRRGKRLMLSTFPFENYLSDLADKFELQIVVIDKLDFRPTAGDYLTVMESNIDQLIEAKELPSEN